MPNDLSDAQIAQACCPLPLARIKEAVACFGDGRPALVLDLARVRRNARRFAAAMPSVRAHYAVKANPDRRVLLALAQEGAGFEIASPAEIDRVRSIGVPAAGIFYSNPVRSDEAIANGRSIAWTRCSGKANISRSH